LAKETRNCELSVSALKLSGRNDVTSAWLVLWQPYIASRPRRLYETRRYSCSHWDEDNDIFDSFPAVQIEPQNILHVNHCFMYIW